MKEEITQIVLLPLLNDNNIIKNLTDVQNFIVEYFGTRNASKCLELPLVIVNSILTINDKQEIYKICNSVGISCIFLEQEEYTFNIYKPEN